MPGQAKPGWVDSKLSQAIHAKPSQIIKFKGLTETWVDEEDVDMAPNKTKHTAYVLSNQ